MTSVKDILDTFYEEYDFRERLQHDPIEFPHRYKDPKDKEVAGFIASGLAYGRVDLFKAVVEKVLKIMGDSPYGFILSFDPEKHRRLLNGLKYRFNENSDIICLLYIMHEILKRYSSLEQAFKKHDSPEAGNIGKGLEGLVSELLAVDTSKIYGSNIRPAGLMQFFPSPAKGSACKRMNLFLRWMVRDKDIDLGIWKGIQANRLVVPLDTHIARVSKCLGLTDRRSQDWKMAVEITGSLKMLDPEDPLKYDFALCHHGISGVCRDRMKKEDCYACVFKKNK